jgi:hypothetical protein
VQNGLVIWPICFFSSDSLSGARSLVLRFSKGGILSSFQILRKDERLSIIGQAPSSGDPLVPADIVEALKKGEAVVHLQQDKKSRDERSPRQEEVTP